MGSKLCGHKDHLGSLFKMHTSWVYHRILIHRDGFKNFHFYKVLQMIQVQMDRESQCEARYSTARTYKLIGKAKQPWWVWFSGLSTTLETNMLLVCFRAHAWIVGQDPVCGCGRRSTSTFLSHTNVPLPLSLPFPLSKNKITPFKKF